MISVLDQVINMVRYALNKGYFFWKDAVNSETWKQYIR
jgi:hypothetical protein